MAGAGHRALVVVGLIASGLCACSTAATAPASAPRCSRVDDLAVRAVLAAQQDAWNRADLEGYLVGYLRDPSIVFTSGGRIRRGWQATRDTFRASYGSSPATMGKLDFEVLTVQPVGADGAVVLGRWRLTASPSAGAGVFSVVLARTPAGWRIIHDHTSLAPVDGP